MKKILLIFLLLNTYSSKVFSQLPQYKNLIQLIDSLYNVDQKTMTDIVEGSQKNVSPEKMKELFGKQNETIKRHIPIEKYIIEKYGYPTINKVGKESSHHFFTLVQHADADVNFQEKILKYIKKEVAQKHVTGTDFAFLSDRVRLAKGQSQLYGSQVNYDDAGNAASKNLYKPKTVDKRRQKFGLEPLNNYLKMMTEVHKSMNPGKYPN